MNKGFTLIELVVVIAITAVLSGVILFTVTQYINKGKDSNLYGNLAILIPAGEVFYNGNGNSYEGFCSPTSNSVLDNVQKQIPVSSIPDCEGDATPGICCAVDLVSHNSWAVCAQEFADNTKAYCVDNRGMKEDIKNTYCVDSDHGQSLTQCPDCTANPDMCP